ncbi:MAG: hypothetical protein HZC28_02490 [Spirochaetes bacterium]|nr:hypothetical protein [Spirochaetota bacterium]
MHKKHCERCGKQEFPLFVVANYTRKYKLVCGTCLLHVTALASVQERKTTHGQIMFDSYLEAGYHGNKSV